MCEFVNWLSLQCAEQNGATPAGKSGLKLNMWNTVHETSLLLLLLTQHFTLPCWRGLSVNLSTVHYISWQPLKHNIGVFFVCLSFLCLAHCHWVRIMIWNTNMHMSLIWQVSTLKRLMSHFHFAVLLDIIEWPTDSDVKGSSRNFLSLCDLPFASAPTEVAVGQIVQSVTNRKCYIKSIWSYEYMS